MSYTRLTMETEMLKKYDELCDSLDACVFNGELVSIKENREDFKKYLDRWRKEIEEWEKLENSDGV